MKAFAWAVITFVAGYAATRAVVLWWLHRYDPVREAEELLADPSLVRKYLEAA